MPVSSDKEKTLQERMKNLGVLEAEIEESFVRSSGPGGQKVNKSSSCVYLVHLPSGLSVKCQKERSQSLNRFWARRLLLDKIERQQRGFIAEEKEKREKLRRQKRRRSRRAKEKILTTKHHKSEKKSLRGKVNVDED